MPRQINIRQVEAFKAVIEYGTVSRAADLLHVSQPAMSKLIANLEYDTGLKLFDRIKGRLAPTANGMRLYGEVERIFAGIRQVESAVDAILREEQGLIIVGVMPALSLSFIQRATTRFLEKHPNVFFTIYSLGSSWILDGLVARKLDIGLVEAEFDNPYLTSEPLIEQPLACVLPRDHPLAAKRHIEPSDLEHQAFVGLPPDNFLARGVDAMLESHGVSVRKVMFTNTVPTICEYVAAGFGLALVPPLMAAGRSADLAIRPFLPEMPYSFRLCRPVEQRNAPLADAFAESLRAIANETALADSIPA